MQSKLVEALAVGALSWQDYANCRGQMPICSFRSGEHRHERPKQFVRPVRCDPNVSTTQST